MNETLPASAVDHTLDNTEEQTREKIVHVLEIWPVISPSMLQIGLGTSFPTSIWKPILDKMVDDGTVKRWEHQKNAPNGSNRSYTRLSLTAMPSTRTTS